MQRILIFISLLLTIVSTAYADGTEANPCYPSDIAGMYVGHLTDALHSDVKENSKVNFYVGQDHRAQGSMTLETAKGELSFTFSKMRIEGDTGIAGFATMDNNPAVYLYVSGDFYNNCKKVILTWADHGPTDNPRYNPDDIRYTLTADKVSNP